MRTVDESAGINMTRYRPRTERALR